MSCTGTLAYATCADCAAGTLNCSNCPGCTTAPNGGPCYGTLTPCSQLDATTCGTSLIGCSYTTVTCGGTLTSCASLKDQTSCERQNGCTWSPSSCTGTPTPCDHLTPDLCQQQGCQLN
jgi:hypothetical protein